jgi:hypothetical protein
LRLRFLRTSPPEIKGKWDAIYYKFLGKKPPFEPINGTMVLMQPEDACHTLTNADALNGNIAVANHCT